jgi:hypothetical protein
MMAADRLQWSLRAAVAELGIFISRRQVGRLLIGAQDGLIAELRDVLRRTASFPTP